ncbi:MAG: hypothetical protein KDK39_11805 [Leptospiraceae bacterium]|nr:hypothetical protein [Leptospiraceae bacterium]
MQIKISRNRPDWLQYLEQALIIIDIIDWTACDRFLLPKKSALPGKD